MARLSTLLLLLLLLATVIRAYKLCGKLRRSEVTDDWEIGTETFVPRNDALFRAVWGQFANLCAPASN